LAKTIIREKQHGEEQGRIHIKKFVRVDSATFPASSTRTNGRGVLYVPAQFQNISMNRKKSSLPEGYFLLSVTNRYAARQAIFQPLGKRPALLPGQ
jgi:hypothetical protein